MHHFVAVVVADEGSFPLPFVEIAVILSDDPLVFVSLLMHCNCIFSCIMLVWGMGVGEGRLGLWLHGWCVCV